MDTTKKRPVSIGIGVTTTPNRKEYFDLWYKKFTEVAPSGYHLHVHDDVHYKGVAYSKNQNLKTLKDCDYIFLFDDDCFPIIRGWENYFINSKEHHLLYLQPQHNIIARLGEIEHYNDCGGVFMYLTREAFETVGYFNPEYSQYGFEHAGYSVRINKAGLTQSAFQQLKDTDKYLLAMDYSGTLPNVKKQMSIEEYQKQKEINKNRKVFMKELQSNQIYYNLEQ